jgi:hypothetical protein
MGLEFKIELVERKILDKVTCDLCGKNVEQLFKSGWNPYGEPFTVFHEPHFNEYFHFKKTWGYTSRKDGQEHEIVLCEDCYDKVFKDVRIKVRDYLEEGGQVDGDVATSNQ